MARRLSRVALALLPLGAALPDEANQSAEEDCSGSELGLLLQARAPECLQACPSLCPRAVQDASAALRAGRTLGALCASRAALACAAPGPRGAEACAPARALARLPSDLEELCRGLDEDSPARPQQDGEDRATAFAAAALARQQGDAGQARPLESSAAGKTEYPLCLGAPEGQTCVPGANNTPSDSMVYCTAGKYKLWGPRPCSPQHGQGSHCVETGIGLQVAQCDDPFCRNGGAVHGDGLYCHSGAVVRCVGEDAPVVVDGCSDLRYQVWGNCWRVTQNHCVSYAGQGPRCELGGASWYEGSDCWRV